MLRVSSNNLRMSWFWKAVLITCLTLSWVNAVIFHGSQSKAFCVYAVKPGIYHLLQHQNPHIAKDCSVSECLPPTQRNQTTSRRPFCKNRSFQRWNRKPRQCVYIRIIINNSGTFMLWGTFYLLCCQFWPRLSFYTEESLRINSAVLPTDPLYPHFNPSPQWSLLRWPRPIYRARGLNEKWCKPYTTPFTLPRAQSS